MDTVTIKTMAMIAASLEDAAGLQWAHPVVRQWFVEKFGTATEPQEAGWLQILAGQTTLIAAPTGSGKTLAAFLACIDMLFRKAISGRLTDKTEVVYVSPLKALSNDVQKNLEAPLGEICQLARDNGFNVAPIRTAVRTGDTLAAERRQMLKQPPHILVTTPESLYILLTAEKSRETLTNVTTVIVDEIHAVADDKRGAHLALTLERLDHLTQKPAVRIGLSATQKPIETIARFLTGSRRKKPVIVDVGHKRALDLAVEVPGSSLGPIASNTLWDEIYDRIASLVKEHRSTLVFVNTRKLAERLTMHLAQRLGEDAVQAHHGSLSRKLRLDAERRLKTGQVKAIVATASLELGIDIGHVDLVCQISSPRSISVALQRVGRAGHWRGAIPKGRFFPTTRDDLVECAALAKAITDGDLDRLIIPEAPMDILCQQIVAMCAASEWKEDDLFKTVTNAYPYADLSRERFDQVLDMLGEGISATRGRYGAYLFRDRVNKRVKARRGGRLVAITSGGAIPDNGMFTVVAEPDGTVVGTLDEDFAVESNGGDIILLGNTSWRVRRVESRAGRMVVEDARGAPPTVPFWLGEAPARTQELSLEVANIRQTLSDMVPDRASMLTDRDRPDVVAAVDWLRQSCCLDNSGAEQVLEYVMEGRAVLHAVPTQQTVIAERFFDEGGGMQLIIHAPFGARITKAWGLALRKRFCRTFNFELQAAATDNGLNISLGEQHSFPLADVFNFLSPDTVEEVVEQAAIQSPIFTTRFRWDATRALALLRFSNGKKVPPAIQRVRADDLLAAVFPQAAACQDNIDGDIELPDHPLINEVIKDVLHEALDVDGLKAVLAGIANGTIRCLTVDAPVPSQFSHEILNANPYAYLDDAPLEERRARAVEMRRILPDDVVQEIGLLDAAAIAQVVDESWPDIRDPDEMQDFLLTSVVLPAALPAPGEYSLTDWNEFLLYLQEHKRAGRFSVDSKIFWVATERANYVKELYPSAQWLEKLPKLDHGPKVNDDPLAQLLLGWMGHIGPTAASQLSNWFSQPHTDVETALLRLEARGTILRGSFASGIGEPHEMQWCDRRLLARIHRLTIGARRKQVEPVTSAIFLHWLTHWQHVAPGSQLAGERGTLEILSRLQGYEIAANAWEPQVLARRVSHYDGDWLDRLCMTGAIGWGRISPHPALLEISEGVKPSTRRIVPSSVAPITFFVREDADWLGLGANVRVPDELLSHAARAVVSYMRQRGASFFADMVRGTGLLKAEVETALWELVAAGLISADGFDNLRALLNPRRRSGSGSGRFSRPRNSTGRWSLLHTDEIEKHKAIEAFCWVLLKRYGVVFRELLVKESIMPKWRDLQMAFRRLEDKGVVAGGRFLSGFIGEQFALPEAVESLRAFRRQPPTDYRLILSAADPLNLSGIVVPGDRIPAISGRAIVIQNGVFTPG